jgi:hypothetical protein
MGWADASVILNIVLILFSVLQELAHAGERRDRDLAWTSVRQWQRFHVTTVKRLHRRHQAALQKVQGWRDSLLKTALYPKGYPTGEMLKQGPPPLPPESTPDPAVPPTPSERS